MRYVFSNFSHLYFDPSVQKKALEAALEELKWVMDHKEEMGKETSLPRLGITTTDASAATGQDVLKNLARLGSLEEAIAEMMEMVCVDGASPLHEYLHR